MSMQLQIAIPLLVTFAALTVIAILRKYFKLETVLIGIVVLGLGVCMTVQHFTASNQALYENNEQTVSDDQTVSLMLAEQYMLERRYDEATEILRGLQVSDGSDTDVLLASARCALLRKDYAASVQLYQQLEGYEDEMRNAVLLHGIGRYQDDSTIAYLEGLGQNAAIYGLNQSGDQTADFDDAAELIRDRLKDHLDDCKDRFGSDVLDAIEYAADLTVSFSKLVADESGSTGSVKTILRKLESCMQNNTDLVTNKNLRLARLKGYILTGDYEKIAKMADRNASAEELLILAELYTSGLINAKDFSDSFANVDSNRYKVILGICKDNLKANKGSLSDEQEEKYEEKLEMLEQQIKAPALFTLRQDLLDAALNGAVQLRSKCYLALAKLEKESGNDDMADSYISDALGTAGASDDENYRIPMDHMSGIIQGSAESDEIKNVAQYVDEALDHSLPLNVSTSTVTGESEDAPDSFGDHMTNTVTQSTATINIGVINKDEFPVVKARVQIQSSKWTTLEELQAHLKVYDCGSQITEFTLEKLDFQKSRIILLCDVSGSMGGSEDSLKQAIISFAEDMLPGEEVCVIGFSSGISFVHEFSSDSETVKSYADSIYASGGTALFDALLYSGGLHTADINTNNIIIAMTDGQDGSPAGEADMYNRVGAIAAEKGITVYTMGLGSAVDTDYLTFMAQCGNGSFLYVDSQESLEAFYKFIHGQLANQYILTYTAKNQTRVERKLELSVEDELGGAEKTYYLVDKEYSNEGSDSYNPYIVEDTDLTINGLSTKFLYKSSQSQQLNLKGAGFDSGDDITIRITGNVKYTLPAEFVDSSTYRIIIPAEVATGVYDLEISVAGETVTLKDELTVAISGDMKNFTFGAYQFTALKSYVNDNGETVLSGNVTMNGWLHFKGDVVIQKGYEDNSRILVTDNSGAYISYTQELTTGLAKMLAEAGIPISFGKLGAFYLYNGSYTPGKFEDFQVDQVDYLEYLNLLCLVAEDFSVSIYPDMARLQGLNFQYKLPFQEQLMRNFDFGGTKSINADTEGILASNRVAILATLEYEDDAEFVMVSLPLKMSKLTVQLNTLNNDYSFEAGVKFKAIGSMDELEFSLGFKSGRFDSIGLRTGGTEVRLMDAPVPISMGDFGFELKDFSEFESDSSLLSKILATDIIIKFDVNVASLNAYLPDIAEIISDDDVALAQLSDCELSLKLKEFRLAFNAKIKLCTILEVGECAITMGKFDYTNALIGYYDETQYGLQAKLTQKLSWDSANLDMSLNGSAELTLGYPYSGLWFNGGVKFDIGWWILRADVNVSGDALIGAYQNSSGNLQFSVIVRGTDNDGSYDGFHLYVTRATGFGLYTY